MEPQSDSRSRVSVVIADDDYYAREALKLLLRAPEIEISALCATANECLAAIKHQPPQVALVDLRMNGDPYAGVTLIQQIRTLSPATICLAMTASEQNSDLLPRAFYAGAHGYYRKSYLLGDDLPRIVCRLAAGAWELDPEMAQRLLHDYSQAGASLPFTPNELGLLRGIASGASADILATTLGEQQSSVHIGVRNIIDKAQLAHAAERARLGARYRW